MAGHPGSPPFWAVVLLLAGAIGAIALFSWLDARRYPIYSDVTPPRPQHLDYTRTAVHVALLREELDRAYAELPTDVRRMLEARGIEVVFSEDDSPNYGIWVPRLNTIMIYSQTPAPEARRVLMHEIAHALGFSHEDMDAHFPALRRAG
jgi:hypothetical protein